MSSTTMRLRVARQFAPVVLVAACFAAARPLGAQAGVRLGSSDKLRVTFTGAIHGVLPPAACAPTLAGAGSANVTGFDETTTAQAAPNSGSFELSIATTCVAAFYQALFAQEPITAQFTFSSGTSSYTLTLANARLTHVDFGEKLVGRTTTVGPIKVGIASTTVTVSGAGVSTPTGTAGTAPASGTTSAPAGVSAAAASAAAASGASTIAATAGTKIALAGAAAARPRIPSFHPATADVVTIPAGNGESWAAHQTVTLNAHLTSASPALDAAFVTSGPCTLSVHATLDAVTGMPTSSVQIVLDPIVRAQDAKSGQIKAAALAHAALTQAVLSFVGDASHTVGITVWLKSAHLTDDKLNVSNATESITIAASQLTVTDVGSGRTASSP